MTFADPHSSEEDSPSDGSPLGAVLIDGDSLSNDDGSTLRLGASLGSELGLLDTSDDGCPDKLGSSLGCDVGQSDDEGFSDG